MSISRLGTVLGTGLLATTLLVGGCTGPTGPIGPVGPTGPGGPVGPTGPADVTYASLTVTCDFDQNAPERSSVGIRVMVQALDDEFDVEADIPDVEAWLGADGTVAMMVPEAFDKVTCFDTFTGDEVYGLVNMNDLTAKAPSSYIASGITSAFWEVFQDVAYRGGYPANSTWTDAQMAALEAEADVDLAGSWWNTAGQPLTLPTDAFTQVSLVMQTIWTTEPGEGFVTAVASVAPAEVNALDQGPEFDALVAGYPVVALGDNTDYQVTNAADDCAIANTAGVSATALVFSGVVYEVNGLANTGAATTGSCGNLVTTSAVTPTTQASGVMGIAAADATDPGQTISWYAEQLHFGACESGDGTGCTDAIHFGAALKCNNTVTVGDCTLDNGSSIVVSLPNTLNTIPYCNGNTDFTTNLQCGPGDVALSSGFVLSTLPAESLMFDTTTPVTVVKNCTPGPNSSLTVSIGATTDVSVVIPNDVTITPDVGVATNTHFGMVIARLDPADMSNYIALSRLSRANANGDTVTYWVESLLPAVSEMGTVDLATTLTPYELAVSLAEGNGLCNAELTQLASVDHRLDWASIARPNMAGAGFAPGRNVLVTNTSADPATTIVAPIDQNGTWTAGLAASAGDELTVQTCTDISDNTTCSENVKDVTVQ